MYSVGRITMSGIIKDTEHVSARGYILRSARNGYVPAMLAMGIFAEEGRGVDKNLSDAEKWYSRTVNSEARNAPELYEFPERFQERARTDAESRIEAQYRLGMILSHNDPSLKSYIKAFGYVASAASMGHEDAQLEISRIYVHGGDLKNYYESYTSIDKAAFENGDAYPGKEILGNAMNKLGDAYFDGKSLVEKNKAAATRCYKIAAELGNVDASYSYGWCLRHGSGIRENDVEAVKWLKIAADKGNANAAYSYGLCCEEGSGTGIKNRREALHYYRAASAMGHSEAAQRYKKLSDNGG
jgi:TPR repeat protein